MDSKNQNDLYSTGSRVRLPAYKVLYTPYKPCDLEKLVNCLHFNFFREGLFFMRIK